MQASAANDPWIDPLELALANARCDAELQRLGISRFTSVRSSWNHQAMVVRGRLTDRHISKYEAQGFYSADFKVARKALMDKKALKRNLAQARNGNFVERDGRLIYSP